MIGAMIIQGMAISLGVGSSTIAVTNFFVAIADGQIDPQERKMMGVAYLILRIAMFIALITTSYILMVKLLSGGEVIIPAFLISQLILLVILFLNAILMTLHYMPSTFGPAIQASSWYTLGIILGLETVHLTNFTFGQFLLGYATMVVLAVSLINGLMVYLKKSN